MHGRINYIEVSGVSALAQALMHVPKLTKVDLGYFSQELPPLSFLATCSMKVRLLSQTNYPGFKLLVPKCCQLSCQMVGYPAFLDNCSNIIGLVAVTTT
jgi:hypothetical protein